MVGSRWACPIGWRELASNAARKQREEECAEHPTHDLSPHVGIETVPTRQSRQAAKAGATAPLPTKLAPAPQGAQAAAST